MPFTAQIQDTVAQAIAEHQTPGAVVLVGRGEEVLYHEAFGDRMVAPERRPMLPDTIFDLASVTKPLATAIAVMQLVERGLIAVGDSASRWLPLMSPEVTIHHLLTHSSGVPAYKNYPQEWGEGVPADERRQRVVDDICQLPPVYHTGEGFTYSCLGYIALASLVEMVSGLPLDRYYAEQIAEPLQLVDSSFAPDAERCAATEQYPRQVLCGTVHDENARYLGGVGGNAGLFATALEVARFMSMVLAEGQWEGRRLLAAETVRQMTSPQLQVLGAVRAWGWDLDTPYSPQLRGSFPAGSFGHSGYTGTSVWADPVSRVFTVILTNRVHLGRDRAVSALRRGVADAVATGLGIAGG